VTAVRDKTAGIATGSTLVLPLPSAGVSGDWLILALGFQNALGVGFGWVPTAPAGWTAIGSQEIYDAGASGDPQLALYAWRKRLDLGEAEVSVYVGGRTLYPWVYQVVALALANVAAPIDAFAFAATSVASTTVAAPTVTTTHTNERLLCWFLTAQSAAGGLPGLTVPGTLTERARSGAAVPPDPSGLLVLGDQVVAATGATGARNSTASEAVRSIGLTVAITPDTSPQSFETIAPTHSWTYGLPRFSQPYVRGPVDEILDHPGESLINVAAKLQPYDHATGAVTEVRVSRIGIAPTPGPRFKGCLVNGPTLDRSIFSRDTIGGPGQVSVGNLKLNNAAGSLDGIRRLAYDARRMDFYLGGWYRRGSRDTAVPFSSYRHVISCRGAASGGVDLNSAVINVDDGMGEYGKLVQNRRYEGTGGMEGGADLLGVVKPVAIGYCPNVEPRRLQTTPTLLLHYHDSDGFGAPRWAGNLKDSGVLVPASLYTIDLATGTLVCDFNPAGKLTLDVEGPAAAGDTAYSQVRFVTSTAGMGWLTYPNGYLQERMLALKAREPQRRHLWLRDEMSRRDAINWLLAPLGWWLPSRLGLLMVGMVDWPLEEPALRLRYPEFNDVNVPPVEAPFSRVALGYGHNATVMTDSDLAGSAIGSAFGGWANQEWRQKLYPEKEPNAAVLAAWPSAVERKMAPSALVDESDAGPMLARLWAVYSQAFLVVHGRGPLRAIRQEPGSAVYIEAPRPELAAGVNMLWVGEGLDLPLGPKMKLWCTFDPSKI
jgi:hypothetical protein